MGPVIWLSVLVGVAVCLWLVRVITASNRRLNERIRELREEEANRQGPAEDPYMALARLYAEDQAARRKARKR